MLEPEDPLQRAVDHTLAGFHQDFPVVRDGRVVGMLTRRDLMTHLARGGPQARVSDCMAPHFQTASPAEETQGAFARLTTSDCRSLPVVDQGRLVGILTLENVGEYLTIQSALRGRAVAS